MTLRKIKEAEKTILNWELGEYSEEESRKVLDEMDYFVNEHDIALRNEHKEFMHAIKNTE